MKLATSLITLSITLFQIRVLVCSPYPFPNRLDSEHGVEHLESFSDSDDDVVSNHDIPGVSFRHGAIASTPQHLSIESFGTQDQRFTSSQLSPRLSGDQATVHGFPRDQADYTESSGNSDKHQVAEPFRTTALINDFAAIVALVFPKQNEGSKITILKDEELDAILEVDSAKLPGEIDLLKEIFHRNSAFALIFYHSQHTSLDKAVEEIRELEWTRGWLQDLVHWSKNYIQAATKQPGSYITTGGFNPTRTDPKLCSDINQFLKLSRPNSKMGCETLGAKVGPHPRPNYAEAWRTRVAISMLGEYYKTRNLVKWKSIFKSDDNFVQLFALMRQEESESKQVDYQKLKDIRKFNIFPWLEEPDFTLEQFEQSYPSFFQASKLNADGPANN